MVLYPWPDTVILVYQGIVLFVAVSPIALGGVRPFIVLSYRYRLSNYRNCYRNTELFSVRHFFLIDMPRPGGSEPPSAPVLSGLEL